MKSVLIAGTLAAVAIVVIATIIRTGHQQKQSDVEPPLELHGGDRFAELREQARLNYACAANRTLTLIVHGTRKQSAVFDDGTNGLSFNLTNQPAVRGTAYGDGTILVQLEGDSAFVMVDGSLRFSDCELRTRSYACDGGRGFILTIEGVDKEQAVFEDGTNRKRFTIYKDAAGEGNRYGDGVILLDLTQSLASVHVDGYPYFSGCVLQPLGP